jgi:3-oxoacyl-[acyl-carrier protein] reductase
MTSAFKLDPASFLLGRLATTDDVAAAAVFLSSPASDYMTGVVLDVNGGMLMH